MMWIAIFVISAIGGLAALHSHSEQRTHRLEQTVKRLERQHHVKRHHVPKVLPKKPTLQGVEVANLEETPHV